MLMRFKRVYVEITNGCNLSCSFCIGNKRKVKFMSLDEFSIILDRVKGYTDYLYFHILGEPLLHPNIIDFINMANDRGFFVNITTNGYLIDKLKGVSNIRQLNISLHSFNPLYGVSLEDYMNNIFSVIDNFDGYVSLRYWVNGTGEVLDYVSSHYNVSDLDGKLSHNVFFSRFREFIWPDINNQYYCEKGRCYGLIDHIGILSDGTVVPCCLDSSGYINLGNIFSSSLDDILNCSRVSDMINGFKNGFKCEEFCRHCSFLENEKKG